MHVPFDPENPFLRIWHIVTRCKCRDTKTDTVLLSTIAKSWQQAECLSKRQEWSTTYKWDRKLFNHYKYRIRGISLEKSSTNYDGKKKKQAEKLKCLHFLFIYFFKLRVGKTKVSYVKYWVQSLALHKHFNHLKKLNVTWKQIVEYYFISPIFSCPALLFYIRLRWTPNTAFKKISFQLIFYS